MQQTRKERKRKCEKCEELYTSAMEVISTDRTRGLTKMTEVVAMDHADRFHSSIEKKAVQDIAKYIESEEGKVNSFTLWKKRKNQYTCDHVFVRY